jgi:hypothetical protein
MGVLIPPGFGQLTFVMTKSGDAEPMMNTQGVDPAGSVLDPSEIAASAYAAWAAGPLTQMPATMVLTKVIYSVGQDGGDPITYENPGSSAGAGGETYLPQNCAVLVRKRTALGGRRNRGRLFVPYLATESNCDAVGILTPSYRTGLQDIFDDLFDAFTTAGIAPVVLHDPGGIGVEPAPTPMVNYVVDNKIATQRRRLRR